MRILKLVAVVAVVFTFVGCMGPTPLQGVFYANVHYPGYYHGATDEGPGTKTGTASMTSYLGVYAVGDAGIQAACEDGTISKIKTVDHHYHSILGIIQTWTTEVTGE